MSEALHPAGSIRGTLLRRLLVGGTAVLLLAGAVVFGVVRNSLAEQFDANLEDRLKGLASLLFQQGEVLMFEFSGELMPEYEREALASYFHLRFEDGRDIERSDSLAGRDIEPPSPGADDEALFWDLDLPDGRPGRAVVRTVEVHHVYPEEGPDRPQVARVSIAIARGIEERTAAERTVLIGVVATILVLLALLSFITLRAVRRGLAPAERLARTLADLDPDRLPERVAFGGVPAELLPVARTTDALVGRLDEALRRERRTTANIAHELRTPISEMVTVSEVALHEEEDPDGKQEAIETVRGIAWRMGRTVSTLLKLARLESHAVDGIAETVDLAELVRAVHKGATLARVGEAPVVELHLPPDPADASVTGDPEALSIVVSNLLENALHHAPRDTTVHVHVERDARGHALRIENAALDVKESDLAHFEEPFWRKDLARSDRDRSGLGLALARAVAERSGLELGFTLEGGAVVARLVIPSAAATNGSYA